MQTGASNPTSSRRELQNYSRPLAMASSTVSVARTVHNQTEQDLDREGLMARSEWVDRGHTLLTVTPWGRHVRYEGRWTNGVVGGVGVGSMSGAFGILSFSLGELKLDMIRRGNKLKAIRSWPTAGEERQDRHG
ncbi:hypothetical protein LX36DRAFT_178690 [Colletotrichum falcatum]|nr:hypothetical protein LX36DRAFT_178690 [Colletotrichum falcatum]